MEPENVPNLNDVAKKYKGKQKIELKKISNKPELQVAFTKRRDGIYKKASELSTLCGVEIAIIMFSENNRVYSFGSPNVNSIIQRYTGWVPPLPLNIDLKKVGLNVDENELHAHIAYLSNQIAEKKKSKGDSDQLMKAAQNQFWFANPIESMNDDQLKIYQKKLEDLKALVDGQRQKLFFESILTRNSTHIFAGGSSSSNVDGPITKHQTPLMQSHENVTHFFAGGSSSSNVDGPVTMHQTPLMQNHEDVTDRRCMNGQGQKNIHTFKFF